MTPEQKARELMNLGVSATAKIDPDNPKRMVSDAIDVVKWCVDVCTAIVDPNKNTHVTKSDIVYWNEVADHCRKYLPANE